MAGLAYGEFFTLFAVLFDEVPHLAPGVAHPGERAVALVIAHIDPRAVVHHRAAEQRFHGGCQLGIPSRPDMGPVAVRLVFRTSAAAQRDGLPVHGERPPLFEIPRFALSVEHDELLP